MLNFTCKGVILRKGLVRIVSTGVAAVGDPGHETLFAGLQLRGLFAHLDSVELRGNRFESINWQPQTPHQLNDGIENITVEALIGRGSMGAVYRGRHDELDRVIAIKVLPAEFQQHPDLVERFRREIKAASRLQHPNVVTVHEARLTDERKPYFVMEHIDGVALSSFLEETPIEPAHAVAIVRDVGNALQHAHNVGVIHRDVKPSNIMLAEDGRAILTDFGVATLRNHPDDADLTATGQFVGTRSYVAPEQMDQKLAADHRSDLYSLGVVFYELLTGQRPQGNWPLPSEYRAEIGDEFDPVIQKLLALSPKARYQSAEELIADLAAVSNPPRNVLVAKPWLLPALVLAGLLVLTAGWAFRFLTSGRTFQPESRTVAGPAAVDAASSSTKVSEPIPLEEPPTFEPAQRLQIFGPSSTGANAGTSVATDGTFAAIGAPYSESSAHGGGLHSQTRRRGNSKLAGR